MRNGSDGQKSMFGSFCKKDALARLVEGLKVEEGAMNLTTKDIERAEKFCSCSGFPEGQHGSMCGATRAQRLIEEILRDRAALHLKREQEPAPGERCPRCGGDITNEGGHGFWCRDEKCKWGWEIDAAQPPQELVSLRTGVVLETQRDRGYFGGRV